MKSLTAPQQAALEAGHVVPLLFVEVAFTSGTQRYCTAGATIARALFNPTAVSEDWLGTGGLVNIEAIRETTNVESTGLRMTLSGIPSAMISLALGEDVQGRPISVWLGVMDSAGALIGTPVLEWQGRIDTLTIAETDDTATITATAESRMASLMKAAPRRYTDADQQNLYPGDLIFNYVPQMKEKVLPFPSKEAQKA